MIGIETCTIAGIKFGYLGINEMKISNASSQCKQKSEGRPGQEEWQGGRSGAQTVLFWKSDLYRNKLITGL